MKEDEEDIELSGGELIALIFASILTTVQLVQIILYLIA